VMNSIASQRGEKLGRAVMIEFPRQGTWSIGFMTSNEAPKALKKTFDKKMVCVFIPTTPNPTSGFFFMVSEENVKHLDVSADEAFRIVVSLGLASREKPAEVLT
jgi:uncharacterized membrane protein